MHIIKFKQSDNEDEKWRVITVIILGCRRGDDICSQYLVRITEMENSVLWDDYFEEQFYGQKNISNFIKLWQKKKLFRIINH